MAVNLVEKLKPRRRQGGHPSAQFSTTLRVHLDNRPGSFAALAEAIGNAGGLLDAIDLVRVEDEKKVRDVTVLATGSEHVERIVEAVREVDGVEVEHVSDRTFLLHLGGKLEVVPKTPLKTRDDLSMAYTPGVARVSQAIADDPAKAWARTIKQNTVAVVSDGTAVLGLGDVGPAAALPVMEGKAVLFKEFGGVDAFPICLDTRDTDEIVKIVTALAPGFGGVNLEDIASPRCFEIERRLRETLDIPVFHDDQHGTAIVVLAGLVSALRVVGKRLEVSGGADGAAAAVRDAAAMECTIRKTLGLSAECRRESCPFWDDAADGCFILARFGHELTQPQVAAWANGLCSALDEARVRSGSPSERLGRHDAGRRDGELVHAA